MRLFLIVLSGMLLGYTTAAQEDLRCGNGPARSWWDVQYYELRVNLCQTGYLEGKVRISSRVIAPPVDSMQIDLIAPLTIQQVWFRGKRLDFSRTGDHYFLHFPFSRLKINDTFSVAVTYSGPPKISKNPPWGSGMVYKKDTKGLRWEAVVSEGEGAAVWFPCKNSRTDEADSVSCHFTAPARYKVIGNGRLRGKTKSATGKSITWNWAVTNPINNYDITFYLGNYVHWHETFHGIKGPLDLDFYVLSEDLQKAKKQFREVPQMLDCFESKLGPYPFYKDGYKLVEAPYLGMEHQSAVAYGNKFKMGYLGKDRSGTGVGLQFDFIIIHESGHEWFGNSISADDVAYSWIQEGFTTYTETIFAECLLGKEKAFAYQRGKRVLIQNDKPVEGLPGRCDEGSGDQYDKAAFMIHMIRMIMDDDARFYGMLRAMNKRFFHQVVSGKMIESFIDHYSGISFDKVFEQYLRQKDLPLLSFRREMDGHLEYRWEHCVKGFNMPLKWEDRGREQWLRPTTQWQILQDDGLKNKKQFSSDFLIGIHWEGDDKDIRP
jgi:aminopeptidase N